MNQLYEIAFHPDYQFLRQAFLVSALASLSFGIIGTFVVVRRIGYLAGAISHCAFGGVGIGVFLQQAILSAGMTTLATFLDPIAIAVLFSIGASLMIGAVQMRAKEREDSIIGAIWALGMALGVLFFTKTKGFHTIDAYLFGDILLVSTNGVRLVGILDIAVLLITVFSFRRLEAVCFDEEFVRLRGIPAGFYFQLLLVLIAVTVVLMIQLVGIILVIALLTLPAATAARLTTRLLPMACVAIILCFAFCWIGLYASVLFNLAAGPMMILVAGICYFFVLIGGMIPAPKSAG
ncbi:MAG: metal ABC transporter permease [Planctomycetaceae bacterium]|jgi:zinc transport system permease protein|nr:metal ABC transporter permease [Planctomycetaceae bacterium]